MLETAVDDLSNRLRENLESVSEEHIEELLTDAPSALEDRMAERKGTDRERLIAALLSTPIEDAPSVTFPALRAEYPEDLELDGSTTTIHPYAAQEFGDTAGRIDARFLL